VGSLEKYLPANCGLEKYWERLVGIGRTEIEDALQRLDILTREETGMIVARNSEVTHELDGTLTTVGDNVNKIVQGTQNLSYLISICRPHLVLKQLRASLKVSYSHMLPLLINAKAHSQRTNHARGFEHGSHPQILQ
jgi:hypothetical protein